MKKIGKYIPEILFAASFFLLWWYLQATQEFTFYNREQEQLFLFDWSAIIDRYSVIGGLSLLVAQFFVQFFSLPLVGGFITAVFCSASAYLLWRTLKGFGIPWWTYPLLVMPALLQAHALSDRYWYYDGLTAFFFAVLFLWMYQAWLSHMKAGIRVTAGIFIAFIGYFLIGPAIFVFASGICVLDFVNRADKPCLQFFSVAAIPASAAIAIEAGMMESLQRGLLPDFYFEELIAPSPLIRLAWLSVPLAMVLAALLSRCRFKSAVSLGLLCVLAIGTACLALCLWKSSDNKTYVSLRLQHDVVTGDWDDILDCREAVKGNNLLLMNYVNLALSHKHLLLSEMFRYRQGSPMALCVGGEGSELIHEIIVLQANIFYWLGDVGGAQNKAFDGFCGSKYGNPSMLQMLVKTNLIYGEHEVAEKYLDMLGKTFGYRRWAEEHRRFLHDGDAVRADAELGQKYACLPDDDAFTNSEAPYANIMQVLKANPQAEAARDYGFAYLLLLRSPELFDDFIKTFPLKEIFGDIPELVQQAIIVFHEKDLDYCRSLGVSEDVIGKYKDFKLAFQKARAGNKSPQVLKGRYGSTYWYHYIFSQNQSS